MQIKKAVIPAAGLGTRFLPATKAQPKEMLPIVDKPTLQYIIEEAVASGIEEILLITGRGKTSIENHFDRSIELEIELERTGKSHMLGIVRQISEMADISYVRQKETKGLGHAIYCARNFVGNDPFAVLLGDDIVYNDEKPCIGQMMKIYDQVPGTILGCQKVPEESLSKYGVVAGEEMNDHLYSVRSLVEKPPAGQAPSNVAVLGRYILSPTIMDVLVDTPPGVGGEIQLTDAINTLANHEKVYAYMFEGRRYDVGSKLGYLEATVEFALRNEELRDRFLAYLKDTVALN